MGKKLKSKGDSGEKVKLRGGSVSRETGSEFMAKQSNLISIGKVKVLTSELTTVAGTVVAGTTVEHW